MKLKPIVAVPILVVVVFALTAVFRFIPASSIGADSNPYLAAVIIQLVIFALPSLLFGTLRGNEYSTSLRLRLPKPSCIILMICAVVLMCAGGGAINYLMAKAFPSLMSQTATSAYAGFAMNSGLFDGLYLILAFAILPAITEEYLFRGIILTEYGSISVSASVLLSAVLFAMCHFSFPRLPSYIFCGIVLGALTYATRSVIAAMIVHTLYNVVVLFFEDYIILLADKNNISGILFFVIAVVLALIASSAGCFEAASLYKGYSEDNVESDHVPKKKKNMISAITGAVFSPFFILMTVMFIIMTIIMGA